MHCESEALVQVSDDVQAVTATHGVQTLAGPLLST
jgi:hypothetical protein